MAEIIDLAERLKLFKEKIGDPNDLHPINSGEAFVIYELMRAMNDSIMVLFDSIEQMVKSQSKTPRKIKKLTKKFKKIKRRQV